MSRYSDLVQQVVKRMERNDFNRPSEDLMRKIAAIIDHTLLKPDSTSADIVRLCEEGDRYSFASVCVNPCWVKLCREKLRNPSVKICSIAGFPLGAATTLIKAAEAEGGVRDGAGEIDMVMNIGWAKEGDWKAVEKDIAAVVETVKDRAIVKVIIEACLLTDEEKIKACLAAKKAGAAYVKTSTGFSEWGAKASDVALMRRVVGDEMGVKASGGIKDLKTALEMVKSGADRIGVSAGVQIVNE